MQREMLIVNAGIIETLYVEHLEDVILVLLRCNLILFCLTISLH